MNFKDRWEKDENGEAFVFTVEMQRRLSQAGLPITPANLAQLNITPQAPSPQAESSYSAAPEPASPRPAAEPKEDLNTFDIQIDPQTGKYIGRMKWYNPKKGYGFLVRGAGEEIFFHKSSTVGRPEDLKEGEWVLYDIEETKKGPEATEIEPYDGDPM
ncbi:MAG: cold shock domain-containing protein [Anaerolineae bacterium]|nr:cold shock domain-containing protein [Anaerolineae bacterium]